MKSLWQHFHMVLFVFQYFTKWNLELFLNFDCRHSWELKDYEMKISRGSLYFSWVYTLFVNENVYNRSVTTCKSPTLVALCIVKLVFSQLWMFHKFSLSFFKQECVVPENIRTPARKGIGNSKRVGGVKSQGNSRGVGGWRSNQLSDGSVQLSTNLVVRKLLLTYFGWTFWSLKGVCKGFGLRMVWWGWVGYHIYGKSGGEGGLPFSWKNGKSGEVGGP